MWSLIFISSKFPFQTKGFKLTVALCGEFWTCCVDAFIEPGTSSIKPPPLWPSAPTSSAASSTSSWPGGTMPAKAAPRTRESRPKIYCVMGLQVHILLQEVASALPCQLRQRSNCFSNFVFLCVLSAVRGRGGTSGWRRGLDTWISSKRTLCSCPSIRSELNSRRGVLEIVLEHVADHVSRLSPQGSLVFSRHLLSWTGGVQVWGMERSKLRDGKEPQFKRRVTGTRGGSRIQKPKRWRRDTTHVNPQRRRGLRDRCVDLIDACFIRSMNTKCWFSVQVCLIPLIFLTKCLTLYVLENTKEEDLRPGPVVRASSGTRWL